MQAFRYQALDAAGRVVAGVVQSDSARQARNQLRARGLLPAEVEALRAQAGTARARPLPAGELSLVTRQLATLLYSGLTMEQALDALIAEATRPQTRNVLAGVRTEVLAGSSLAVALGAFDHSFPDFYRALVRGGEESGALARVLHHLAEYLDARQALLQKTSLALLYPLLVTLVAILIVGGLLIYVVPQVVQVFEQSRQTLPLLTRVLIAVSDFLRAAWPYLVVAGAATVAVAHLALGRPAVARRRDAFLLRLPWLGALIRSTNTSRFASTLAILVGGGVPLLAALASGVRVMTNVVMRDAALHAVERVREGTSLARALGETQVFPPLLVHLVASGETSGRLEQMLERAAQLETRSLERRLAVFLTLLEPVMILVMGGVVLLIVLAILLPIMELNQLVR